MFNVIDDLRESLVGIYTNIDKVALIFETYAYVLAYNYMVYLGNYGLQHIQEFQRVPEYSIYFRKHFSTFYKQHISIEENRIIDRDILATPQDLAEWQFAGWPNISRTSENYNDRLENWAAIYDGRTIFKEGTYITKTGKTAKYRVEYEVRNPFTHRVVTQKEVISWRNQNYGNTLAMLPFWLPLNYGTHSAEVGPREGYPTSAGVHFVEKAEIELSTYLSICFELFETYIADSLFNLVAQDDFLNNALDYIDKNIHVRSSKNQELDVYELTKELIQ